MVDQTPIGRTTRSNPASYVGAFDAIRKLFAATPLARERDYTPGTFSFNSGNGRCPTCGGNGFEHVEMQFLSDVYLRCPDCDGRRYRAEVLEVTIEGKSIADVLELTVSRSARLLRRRSRRCRRRSTPLADVGLEYLRLGQPVPTLSGGEAQRLKLAGHLAEAAKPHCLASGRTRAASSRGEGQARHAVPLRRADDRPALRRRREAAARLPPADRRRAFAGGDRAQPRRDRAPPTGSSTSAPRAATPAAKSSCAGTPQNVMRRDALAHRRGAARSTKPRSAALAARSAVGAPDGHAVCSEPLRRDLRARRTPSASTTRASTTCKNIDVAIPRDRFTVVTGVSGSGKITLAFDILFAEGQRRYLESLNAYARQFVQPASRPDVDAIFGIPPTVAIEQRTSRGGRKSTVATLTEIYHFLRLLYVKLGTQHCPDCDVADRAAERGRHRRAHPARLQGAAHRPARAAGRRAQGLLHRSRQVGARQGLSPSARRRRVPADRSAGRGSTASRSTRSNCRSPTCVVAAGQRSRAARGARARARIRQGRRARARAARTRCASARRKRTTPALASKSTCRRRVFSTKRACPSCGRSFPELDPRLFSFNSKHGWCADLLRHRREAHAASTGRRADSGDRGQCSIVERMVRRRREPVPACDGAAPQPRGARGALSRPLDRRARRAAGRRSRRRCSATLDARRARSRDRARHRRRAALAPRLSRRGRASATSRSTARRRRSPAAKRSASASPRSSARTCAASATSSTSRRSACTRATTASCSTRWRSSRRRATRWSSSSTTRTPSAAPST